MPRLAYAAPLIAILLAASAAHAQPAPDDAPPGMCTCGPAPAVVAVVPALRRWSVGLHASSLSTVAKDTNDKVDWGGGGLDLFYRIAPRWELGVEADGAREKLDGGGDGPRQLGMGLVLARFHPWPRAVWDLYGVLGFGAASIADAGSDGKADRGAGAIGFGLERRFGHLAIAVELRSIGLGPETQAEAQPDAGVTSTTAASTPAPAATASTSGGFNGGSFSLAASYEF